MILLDTDHFAVLTDADESVAIPVVAGEEHLRAWLAQLHRVRDVHEQVNPAVDT